MSATLLESRGIGKRYHKMSLKDYPGENAKQVLDWVNNDALNDLAVGKGVCLFGTTAETYELAMLTARAMILKNFTKLECVSLVSACEDDYRSYLWQENRPLLITNFIPYREKVSPLDFAKLEDILNYQFDRCISVSLHVPMSLETLEENLGLMNPVLLDQIKKNNKIFQF